MTLNSGNAIFQSLSSKKMEGLVSLAKKRIIFAAPGIQKNVADAIIEACRSNRNLQAVVCIDLDERTLRMGYGSLAALEALGSSDIQVYHYAGFRSGVLIIDGRGWIFSPTPLYLEHEPQSDETPNAINLTNKQVAEIAIRLSSAAKEEAILNATSEEEIQSIEKVKPEINSYTVAPEHFESVKAAIQIAPPVKFDVAKQVRVFEPYLQYVEMQLTGAAVQRHRVQIPSSLLNIGASKDLEGKLKTTFELIEKDSKFSSKALEGELNKIRNDYTPSLGKDHGRVVLKSAKPHLSQKLDAFNLKMNDHKTTIQKELQAKLDESKKQIINYYLPMVIKNPPDVLIATTLDPKNEATCRKWIDDEISKRFPKTEDLIKNITLEVRYKDITFETLNEDKFLAQLKEAFPRVDWDKAYKEFKALEEK